MKTILLVIFIYSSFFCKSQIIWKGEFSLKYLKELKISRESKVMIWSDNATEFRWSFRAYQQNKMIWEAEGIAIQKDSNTLEMFLKSFKSDIRKWNNKVEKKTEKDKPYYIVSSSNDLFFIENRQGGKKRKLQMIKQP